MAKLETRTACDVRGETRSYANSNPTCPICWEAGSVRLIKLGRDGEPSTYHCDHCDIDFDI